MNKGALMGLRGNFGFDLLPDADNADVGNSFFKFFTESVFKPQINCGFLFCIYYIKFYKKGFDKMKKTKKMVESAVMICLSTILSMITLLKMPLGGSVTLLSMLPVCIISIKHGVRSGLLTAFVYSLIQLILDITALSSWGITFNVWIGCIIFDYIFPFTILGISGIFGKETLVKPIIGIVLAMLLRFISHIVSGTIFFAAFTPDGWNPLIYSICYNFSYMFPEIIFTVIGSIILLKLPQTKKLLN